MTADCLPIGRVQKFRFKEQNLTSEEVLSVCEGLFTKRLKMDFSFLSAFIILYSLYFIIGVLIMDDYFRRFPELLAFISGTGFLRGLRFSLSV
jgi:hypothetical protein